MALFGFFGQQDVEEYDLPERTLLTVNISYAMGLDVTFEYGIHTYRGKPVVNGYFDSDVKDGKAAITLEVDSPGFLKWFENCENITLENVTLRSGQVKSHDVRTLLWFEDKTVKLGAYAEYQFVLGKPAKMIVMQKNGVYTIVIRGVE